MKIGLEFGCADESRRAMSLAPIFLPISKSNAAPPLRFHRTHGPHGSRILTAYHEPRNSRQIRMPARRRPFMKFASGKNLSSTALADPYGKKNFVPGALPCRFNSFGSLLDEGADSDRRLTQSVSNLLRIPCVPLVAKTSRMRRFRSSSDIEARRMRMAPMDATWPVSSSSSFSRSKTARLAATGFSSSTASSLRSQRARCLAGSSNRKYQERSGAPSEALALPCQEAGPYRTTRFARSFIRRRSR